MKSDANSANSSPTLLDTWDPRLTKELNKLSPHPETGRLIDSYSGTRTKPMRVLCLGKSRTGTMTLFTALQRLGYSPYHMALAVRTPKTSLGLWREALEAKYYGKGKKWGREEFDKILGDYDSVLDVPCICFVQELASAYPEAKVILTLRDVETWMKSMDNTIGLANNWRWSWVARWDPSTALPIRELSRIVIQTQFGTKADFVSAHSPARKAFQDHYETVRLVVSKERLLDYTVQEGWEPLCEFLGVDIPNETFPRVNDAKQFVYAHSVMWWQAFAKMVGKIGAMVAVPLIGIVAAIYYGRQAS